MRTQHAEIVIYKRGGILNKPDDFLKFDDNDLLIPENTSRCDRDSFIGKDIAEGDVYGKEVLFADGLNGMQRNAVALHLRAIRIEYSSIDHDDQHAVNEFWHRKKERILEDHGFMNKDIDAVIDVLRKNVELQPDN